MRKFQRRSEIWTLAGRAGETVRKSELMARVWPDTIVEEDTLRVQIAALRKALGDGRADMRYVENVTGRCRDGGLSSGSRNLILPRSR
jgi:DNA-binding winged helix-turn-helix (wHTH) protein